MASLIEQLIQTHGAEVSSQISNQLGIPVEKAAGLLPAVAPMILGGLQRQAQDKGGADRVDHILDKHGDESILDNLGGFFSSMTGKSAPDPGLGGLLGDAGHQATDLIGNQLGISKDKAMQIIPMIAPIILGFLMRQRNQAGDSGAGQSLLMGLLDQDGDGSILDDVAGMLGGGGGGLASILGGAAQATQASSGGGSLLGKVLGGLLGGKK
ncbi:MAG: DUF937 domain-containing protein [Verrucomicrobiae bacterium]|nr:DUF937 domain-containing protein [Verrucomicrobiae bacterium]